MPAKRKITDEQIAEVCRLYTEENIRSPKLSELFKVSTATIKKYLKKNNVKIKRIEVNPGDIFGRWTVIEEIIKRRNIKGRLDRFFFCECSCPLKTRRIVDFSRLRDGSSKSCGCLKRELTMKRKENVIGETYGRLTVIKEISKGSYNTRWVIAQCSCDGNIDKYRLNHLRSGETTSCGCYASERIKERNTYKLKDYQEKYHSFCTIEEIRDCKEGLGVEVKCKKCGRWFKASTNGLHNRIAAIEYNERSSLGTENNLYCSEKCKQDCDTYWAKDVPKSLRNVKKVARCNQQINRKALMDLQIDEYGYNYCEKCGRPFDSRDLALHHNIMISKDHDMADDMSHQLLCCRKCHKHKGC